MLKIRKNKLIVILGIIMVIILVALSLNFSKVSSFMSEKFNHLLSNSKNDETNDKVSEINSTLLGDVNLDGIIDNNDIKYLEKYLGDNEKNALTAQGTLNADVNKDEVIDNLDLIILSRYLEGLTGYEVLPFTGELKTTLYGDVNEDGEFTSVDLSMLVSHVEGKTKIENQALENADINADGKVNLIDVELARGILAGAYEHTLTQPLKNYVLYGDVNEDGKFEAVDLAMLVSHVEGKTKIENQALKNADINADGKVNLTDVELARGILAGAYEHTLTQPLKK